MDYRCYTDREWAQAVAREWRSYDPCIDVKRLKFFRAYTYIGRAPRWSIGMAELWRMKRSKLAS